ncbi:hypothetical protein B0H19DRAFT_1234891, partial [Mycena capillaripes]
MHRLTAAATSLTRSLAGIVDLDQRFLSPSSRPPSICSKRPSLPPMTYLCVLSALSPYKAGPVDLVVWNGEWSEEDDEVIQELAEEVAEILGPHGYSLPEINAILKDSLMSDTQTLEKYTGRNHGWKDDFYLTSFIIGPDDRGVVELKRVEDFNAGGRLHNCFWETLVVSLGSKNGRKKTITRYDGGNKIFCYERPYQYFEHWMRHSCRTVALWDQNNFAEQFFRLVNSNRRSRTYCDLVDGISYG